MTLVALPNPVVFPGMFRGDGALATVTTLIDSAGEYVALICEAPRTGNIEAIGYLTGSATGSPSVDARIETVDATGFPSGTLFDTNTNASHSPSANTFAWVTLTSAAAVNAGEFLALKIAYSSGTSVQIRSWGTLINSSGLPYRVVNIGTPSKSAGAFPVVGVRYDDGTVGYTGAPLQSSFSLFSNSYNSGTTPDEVGIRFVAPMSCRCSGLSLRMSAITTTYTINLYDSLDNLIATRTGIDGDIIYTSNSDITLLFSTPVELTAGEVYRATLLPDTTTSVTLAMGVVDSAASMASWPWGTAAQKTERTNAGAWTDTNTHMPLISLLLSALDDGAGGGGGLAGPVVGLSSPVVRAA